MFLLKNDYWEIKETQAKGRGVYAKKNIPQGTIIGDYLGKVIKTEEYDLEKDKDGLYLMYLTDEASIYPHLSKPGIYLLNHSCRPNCWIYPHMGHTLFFAFKDIVAGDELTISYLLNPLDGTCKPCSHECKCGNNLCTNTMHTEKKLYDRWQVFQDTQIKKSGKLHFTFGEDLPMLYKYPKIDINDPIYKIITPERE
ncbi:hypothetical protein BH09PAT1_BH09PAT1_6070 [soil metagenome]